jgi:cation transport ATPase
LIITFLVGILMIVDYFTTFDPIKSIARTTQTWVVIVSTIALGLGVANLTLLHGRNIRRKAEKWYLSAWLIFIMFLTVIMGVGLSTSNEIFRLVFDNLYLNPYNAVVTLLCFSTFAAGYRAFRIRTFETGVFFVSAAFVMLMLAPIGEVLWVGFPIIGGWIKDVPSAGSMRGLMFGAAVGLVAVGIKTLLGIERGWLGRREQA